MRFSNSLNVDVTTWKNARMDRERSIKVEKMATEEKPKFGLGSKFGQEAREEALKRRYGSGRSKKDAEDVPWLLKVATKGAKNRYRGTREGGVTENTSYYVFFQAHDGAFEAFPVSEWYNFMSIPKYKALTAEEAEEQFVKRDKILNHFAVMASKNRKDGIDGETSTLGSNKLLKNIKREKEFKVTELDEWGLDSDVSDNDNSDQESRPKLKGKGKGGGKKKGTGKRKKKNDSDDDDDSEPGEESDEGDFDTREVDYMSDSSSSSEDIELEEKVNKEMKGVEDEDALRKLVISDDEQEEEEGNSDKSKEPNSKNKNEKEGETKTVTTTEAKSDTKKKPPCKLSFHPKLYYDCFIACSQTYLILDIADSGSSASDDSDDSDFDDSKFQSAMFMQKETSNTSKNGPDQIASGSRSNTASNNQVDSKHEISKLTANNKRKIPVQTSGNLIPNKKVRQNDNGNGDEDITEESVRRYLMRKPMTLTELLKKLRCKRSSLDKNALGHKIALLLKKINPERQKIKDKLYLSVRPDQP